MTSKKILLFKPNPSIHNELQLEGPMTRCFQISPHVEMKDVPTNGEEYLMKVIQERNKYSNIIQCDYSQFAQNQSSIEVVKCATTSEYLIPTKEWQNLQVADFSDIQMYILRLHAKKQLWPKDFTTIRFDGNSWKLWKQFFENNEPTLTCVLGLKPFMLDRGLEYLINRRLKYVGAGQTINYKTGQWIYAFLACITHPVLADTSDILRNLLRRCVEIRSHFKTEDEASRINVMSLNLFICLVSRYFEQQDLADPIPPKAYLTN